MSARGDSRFSGWGTQ